MNVILAGVKPGSKVDKLSQKKAKPRGKGENDNRATSPISPTSPTSPTSPILKRFHKINSTPTGVEQGSESESSNRKTESPSNKPALKESRQTTEFWIRPTLNADTEITDDARDDVTPISFMTLKTAEIRTKKVDWKSYFHGQIITQDQLDCIVIMETYGADKRSQLWNKYGIQCARILSEMTKNISQDGSLQCLLTLINDLLQEDRTRIAYFHEYAASLDGTHAWNLFMPFLNREDLLIRHQSSRIVAKLACWSSQLMTDADLQIYLVFLKQEICSLHTDYKPTAARCLQMMLRIDEYRIAFADTEGITAILSALRGSCPFQLQYQLIFCLWCLTFNMEIASKFHKYQVVLVLAGILRDSQKEKVTRIILSTFRNLLEKVEDVESVQENALAMLHSRVLRKLNTMDTQRFQDTDMLEDIEYLLETLENNTKFISSYDEYLAEVKSGNLEWSPVHKSERFWRENVLRFNDNNYEVLKILARLLEVSQDPLILSVAIHDLGEYMRYNPRGRTVMEQLGGKERALALLSHEDSNVRYQALLALQKMMVHKWEFLGRKMNVESGKPEDNATE